MSGFGDCWCHARHGLHVPADSHDKLCATCRGRSPSACERAHRREAAVPADFPFPLAEPSPEPVMVTRPCGCTSMVTEPEARPVQVSWCVSHDPGCESEEASR